MAKKGARKKKSTNGGGFLSSLFDIFTALLIIAAAAAAVWYMVFYSPEPEKKSSVRDRIDELSAKDKKTVKETPFDPHADEEEQEKIDAGYFDGEDEMTEQFEEEFASNFSPETIEDAAVIKSGFEKSVKKWSSKYTGLPFRMGARPDKDRASDNSHLLCSIWEKAAMENGMKFSGYMSTEKIIGNLVVIQEDDLRNGDVILLKNGMIGMITDLKGKDDFSVIYASESQSEVVKTDSGSLKTYWLKPENFRSFNRLSGKVLN